MFRQCLPAAFGAAALLFAAPLASAGPQPVPERLFEKPASWFATAEARRLADNTLTYQSDWGGWPKNISTTTRPYTGIRSDLEPTFDNGATTGELRFLAHAFRATKDARYRDAFLRGLDYILVAQYPTGGWPQYFPPSPLYHRHITFNDNSMERLLRLLREIADSDLYAFVDAPRIEAVKTSFRRGIDCILKCQIKVNGKLTVWCAQHDENDYSPRPGRAFELTSLSGSESVGLTKLLMEINPPRQDLVDAVEGAVTWFRAAALQGMKVQVKSDPESPTGKNRVVVEDTSAPDLWARFYEIGTNQPIFSDRDGVAKRTLAEIGYERRNGYSWLSNWPSTLLTKDYPAWKARISKTKILPPALPWQPRVRIALVGDSTVKDDGGWGFGFKKHLAADTLCINLAQAGRSSKSYRDEGWWEKALAQKPDYMLIQFGHNDQPGKGPTRETDPATTFPENMGRYVDEARAAGIMPVLVTSMTRRKFGEDGKIASDLVAYAEAVKNVAAEKRVPLIDLHARSIAALDKLGPKASEDFDRVPHSREVEPSATPPGEVASASSSPEPSASPAPPTRDKTHLSPKGSDVMGAIAAKELGSVVPELKRALR